MGRLGCKCGRVLSNVDCPNDVDLWGFDGSTLNNLLKEKPEILLTDVVMDYNIQGLYFWYCKDCGRVYVFKNNHQMWDRVYLMREYNNDESVDDVLKMRELWFYTDKQMEEPTEKDFNFSLKNFFNALPHPYKYFISSDQERVFAYNTHTQTIDHLYQLEATPTSEVAEHQ